MYICFVSNRCFIISNKNELDKARAFANKISKAIFYRLIENAKIDDAQFNPTFKQNTHEIHHQIKTLWFDPFVFKLINLGEQDNFQKGYEKVCKLSQLNIDEQGNTSILL